MARVEKDRTAARAVYAPGHPDGNANGFVSYPEVDVRREMDDLIVSYREYKSDLAVVNTVLRAGRSAE